MIRRRAFLIRSSLGFFAYGAIASCRTAPPAPETGSVQPVTLTVSAAASLQDVLEAIAPQFQAAHPEIALAYNFGSSGALQRQIEQGAPADIFFAAATQQMDALASQGLIHAQTRRDVIANRLVLIAPENSALQVADFTRIEDAPIARLAVGEFRSVPAGQYAEQALEKFALLDPLRSKFIFGSNVRSVLAAVASGSADLGLVYATDAALSDRVKILATVPTDAHAPIRYPIAVLSSSPQPDAAQQFIDFLLAEAARQTFRDFGFTPLPPTSS